MIMIEILNNVKKLLLLLCYCVLCVGCDMQYIKSLDKKVFKNSYVTLV